MDTVAFGLALGVGLLVAALRMYLMGDLPPVQVVRSSAIWGLGTFMGLGGALWLLSRILLSAVPPAAVSRPSSSRIPPRASPSRAPARPAATAGPAPEISPEALNQAEEEATLVERPAPARIQGAAPPEVATAIRDLMKEG